MIVIALRKQKKKKEEKKFAVQKKRDMKQISLITIVIGLIITYVNLQVFVSIPQIFSIVNLIAVIVVLGVPLLVKYSEYSQIKKLENHFPKLMRDITENIRTGMTLPQAIRAASANNYDILTAYVKELNAKISWGIPFDTALMDFADKTRSDSIKRTVQTVIEAHRSGGTIETVMEAVVDSLRELEKIKKERSASVYSQMINGYLIYIVFLGVMVGMSAFLIPTFQFENVQSDLRTVFSELFRNLIIIQGFFAGIAIGKMAEGNISAGIKHSMVLVIFGYTVFLFFG